MLRRKCIFSYIISFVLIATVSYHSVLAQNVHKRIDLKALCDSLAVFLKEKYGVRGRIQLDKIVTDKDNIDFFFNKSLGDFPIKEKDIKWLKNTLGELLPQDLAYYDVSEIYVAYQNINELASPELHNKGKANSSKFRVKDLAPIKETIPIVRPVERLYFKKGLSDRHIALWQSHGLYFDKTKERWQWQRAATFRTVEDCYTLSYVIPFLIPMLENAGAYVLTPRERDSQKHEIIIDNDPCFEEERSGLIRQKGEYKENGEWEDAGSGFADLKKDYLKGENPFTMGTARKCNSFSESNPNKAEIIWSADIPERGYYAVYISYKSFENSSTEAHYTVNHMGGKSEFLVNQKMGGGTWIYLGNFEFDKGKGVSITLDNATISKGNKNLQETVISADAIKIGGGMGKISFEQFKTSSLPSYLECALYWLQWAGIDDKLTEEWDDDYTKDLMSRAAWVNLLSGGSYVNPQDSGKAIPLDLALAIHSDAGKSPNDSTIGTMAIYSLYDKNNERLFPTGEDRLQSRELADFIQTQVVSDIQNKYEPDWGRRFLWDRAYAETKNCPIPAVLLELLSHQNFADMKYGWDPSFRFSVCRAIYKGVLKFLSNRYGRPYAVQPLPVYSLASNFVANDSDKIELSWKEQIDSLEPTARANNYIVYTRINDGAFDKGVMVKTKNGAHGRIYVTLPIKKGQIYSYKVVAVNHGGLSFPSEILSVGIPLYPDSSETSAVVSQDSTSLGKTYVGKKKPVMIVNNFDRVAAPTWFDTESYAGFRDEQDSGVPYLYDIAFVGEQYNFKRKDEWKSNDNPGFGASHYNKAGIRLQGNSFDYTYQHGKVLMDLGYPFYSVSRDAFCNNEKLASKSFAMDLICGKQVTTVIGRGTVSNKYEVFPLELQKALEQYCLNGKHLLLSGAYIGTDVWDEVYPAKIDSSYRETTIRFVKNNLGYKCLSGNASLSGEIVTFNNKIHNSTFIKEPIYCHMGINEHIYSLESIDAIIPANKATAGSFLRYGDTNTSAGVCFIFPGQDSKDLYKVVSLGFPIEALKKEEDKQVIIQEALNFFEKQEDDNTK